MSEVPIHAFGNLLAEPDGAGGFRLSVQPRGGAAVTLTQTLVTLAAGVSQTLIAANANRRYLAFANVGANPMTVAPGAVTVTAGQGMNYSAGEAPSFQGGGQAFEGSAVATSAFSAVSAVGTTVCIWEG